MYSYDAQDTDELSFTEGDIIEIVHEGKWYVIFYTFSSGCKQDLRVQDRDV